MDLFNFKEAVLWAKYATPQKFGVHFQMINFNSAYSQANDSNTLKYNAIELFATHVGDQVLLAFAHVLSENTRSQDLLSRWGGEEFVLACPNTSLEKKSI